MKEVYKFTQIIVGSVIYTEISRVFLILCFSLFIFWSFFFSYGDLYHYSISRNLLSGEISIEKSGGISITAPWVQVSRIDSRPIKSCVDCSCNNITCKLISFNPDGYLDFLDKEGFGYYWWRNRISFNLGNKLEYRGLSNVLRGYAFDNKEYSFITVSEIIEQ